MSHAVPFALIALPGVSSALLGLAIWLVVVPLGLRGIFEALGVDRSRAWIPFVNLATVYRLGGLSEFWLIALVIPGVDVLGAIMLFIASHRINRRLGRSGWYTLLAVVLWWVWTLALGLQQRVDRSANAEPQVWSVQPRPQNPLLIPGSDDSTPVPRSAQPATPPSGLPGVIPGPEAGEAEPAPAPAEADPAELSAAPEPAEQSAAPEAAEPAPAEPAPAEPAADEPAAAASPAVGIPGAVPLGQPDDDDATILRSPNADATIVSIRRRPQWWVHTAMGARIELTGSSAILGRRPAPHPLYPGAQLIAVTDEAHSVSATHAVLEFVGGDWQVTDLDSTNGVWLVDPETGAESEIGARNRARVTPEFMLGELGVRVVHSG